MLYLPLNSAQKAMYNITHISHAMKFGCGILKLQIHQRTGVSWVMILIQSSYNRKVTYSPTKQGIPNIHGVWGKKYENTYVDIFDRMVILSNYLFNIFI